MKAALDPDPRTRNYFPASASVSDGKALKTALTRAELCQRIDKKTILRLCIPRY